MPSWVTSIVFSIIAAVCPTSEARDAARDLRRMVGYTIVAAATISSVVEDASDKIVVLDNGQAYRVTMMLLPPLPSTDVIVFANQVDRRGAKAVLTNLLIDNEALDAVQVR